MPGLQRSIIQNILSSIAGATAQVGLWYALPEGWDSVDEIEWQSVISGGVFSALTVSIDLSEDGVNALTATPLVSDAGHVNNGGVIFDPTGKVPMRAAFIRASISGGAITSGSPSVAVNIRAR